MRRLLLDQGLPRSASQMLRQIGWDVVHVSEIGMSRSADREILAHALAERRVCVTLDADFHTILATTGAQAPSAVRVRREGLNAAAMSALLQEIWPQLEAALDAGAIATVTPRSVRVRKLPIT